MTPEDAINVLTLEFDFTGDEQQLLEDAIGRVASSSYKDGYGDGYAAAIEDADTEEDLYGDDLYDNREKDF